MKIRGREVKIDVEYELRQYKWQEENWTDGTKLICCSPFRPDDGHPSFFVRLTPEDGYEEGLWADSGAADEEWSKGGFVKLYAFLNDLDTESAADLLLEMYHSERTELVWRPVKWKLKTDKTYVDESVLSPFSDPNTYLLGRNIHADVIAKFGGGESQSKRCISIPWRDVNGKLANVKYRKTTSKLFWYQDEGIPIKDLLWGLDKVYEENRSIAMLVESEIDALTSWSYGLPAIALGGGAFSTERAEKLIKSPLQKLIIATDNDAVGERIRRQVTDKLKRHLKLAHLHIPLPYKDVNDIPSKPEFKHLLQGIQKEITTFILKK